MNVYENEAEYRFHIPKDTVPKLIVPQGTQKLPTLTHIRTYTITQKWLTNGLTDSELAYRTRVRAQTQVVPTKTKPIYTYTTKFDLPDGTSIEANAPITKSEYAAIADMFYGETTIKTRIVAQDNETGLYYTFDLEKDEPNARVEIEFGAIDTAKTYTKPEWLTAIEIKE